MAERKKRQGQGYIKKAFIKKALLQILQIHFTDDENIIKINTLALKTTNKTANCANCDNCAYFLQKNIVHIILHHLV